MYRITVLIHEPKVPADVAQGWLDRLRAWADRHGQRVIGAFADHRAGLMLTLPRSKRPDDRFGCFLDDASGVTCAEGYVYAAAVGCDAVRIAALVREEPSTGPPSIAGHYAVAHYDRERDRVVVLTDRYGVKPMFEATVGGLTVFSHDYALVADNVRVDRTLDRVAAAQLVAMEFIADDRTLLSGIARLPHGVRVVVDRGRIRRQQYWNYPFGRSAAPTARCDEILEGLRGVLDTAMDVELDKSGPDLLVLLSGGMDSRLILAHMAERRREPVEAVTFDMARRSAEIRYAARTATVLGARWRWLDAFPPIDWGRQWRAFVERLGAWASIYQAWSTPGFKTLDAPHPRRVLQGFAFDTQLATNPFFAMTGERSHDDTVDRLVDRYAHLVSLQGPRVFSPRFLAEIGRYPREVVRARLASLEGLSSTHLADFFFWTGRAKSYTAAEINGNAHVVRFGFPYLHPDVFDYVMAIPANLKDGHSLYASFLRRRFPEVAHVPSANTGAVAGRSPSLARRLAKSGERLEYYITRLSRGRLERAPSAFDYAACFRQVARYRRDLLGVFENRRVVEEDLVDEEGLERLVTMVDRGVSYFFPWLLRLASVELALARFVP
jgi:asparagine synthetase B (glutamine-hydrolysing)